MYGTVYNNVDSIEKSIQSIFRPEYDMVVVDSFSSDGTYQKLLSLRKEYNFKLLQLKSSRGTGRAYALKNCPKGSRTAYVDFDVIYNDNFHKLMFSDVNKLFAGTDQKTFYVKREDALRCNGWCNLNTGEIENFIIRNGAKATVPAIIGFNLVMDDREKRYAQGLHYKIRELNNEIDWIRGEAFKLTPPYTAKALICHIIARAKGVYKNSNAYNNCVLVDNIVLNTFTDPLVFGISDFWTMFLYLFVPDKRQADDTVREIWGNALKFMSASTLSPEEKVFVYVKNRRALRHIKNLTLSYRIANRQFIKQCEMIS